MKDARRRTPDQRHASGSNHKCLRHCTAVAQRSCENAGNKSLAWAFAAWRPAPDGRPASAASVPACLLTDVRNVGFAHPWMRPGVDFHGWMPASTLDRADVSRQWRLGAPSCSPGASLLDDQGERPGRGAEERVRRVDLQRVRPGRRRVDVAKKHGIDGVLDAESARWYMMRSLSRG